MDCMKHKGENGGKNSIQQETKWVKTNSKTKKKHSEHAIYQEIKVTVLINGRHYSLLLHLWFFWFLCIHFSSVYSLHYPILRTINLLCSHMFTPGEHHTEHRGSSVCEHVCLRLLPHLTVWVRTGTCVSKSMWGVVWDECTIMHCCLQDTHRSAHINDNVHLQRFAVGTFCFMSSLHEHLSQLLVELNSVLCVLLLVKL